MKNVHFKAMLTLSPGQDLPNIVTLALFVLSNYIMRNRKHTQIVEWNLELFTPENSTHTYSAVIEG